MLTRRQFLTTTALTLVAAAGCSLRPGGGPTSSPETPPEEDGPRPFRVALLSDPHTTYPDASIADAINGKLQDAVNDYKSLRPDLWLVNGDITNNGRSEQYEAFKRIMAKVTNPESLLVTTGNHDFYDSDAADEEELRRFMTAFGLKTPYSSHVAGGLHFVMLADEQYKGAPYAREWAWLTDTQLRWFEGVLAEHRDLQTVVCLHQPLPDTITWTWGGNDFAGCGQAADLVAIMRRNPQVRLFLSGHTHMGAEIPGNVASKGGVTYVGLGSTFYHFVQADGPEGQEYGGFKKDLGVSQSRFMEVWPDRIVLRARDHIQKAWMEQYELVLKRG